MAKEHPVGVIGSGSFGITIAKLLSINQSVVIWSRRKEIIDSINEKRSHLNIPIPDNVRATGSPADISAACRLIFPAVPSAGFRAMMREFSPFLNPSHFLIHCTKGFDLDDIDEKEILKAHITREQIRTMSQVITEESSVVRVGCLSGPNLASEILAGQPTASVIASKYNEVITHGKKALDGPQFAVFGSQDIIGAELAGALKNIIAIGSGILGGLGMGKNIQAMLITRGLREMIQIGKVMGSETKAFLGTAGIGDLIATATSNMSRNYNFGARIARGESMDEIIASITEVAEGVRTLKITQQLSKHYKLNLPIISMIYNVVFEQLDVQRAIQYLMRYSYSSDVDFF